jgi:hypothetical protein
MVPTQRLTLRSTRTLSLRAFGFLVFAHPRAAGWARLTFFVRPRNQVGSLCFWHSAFPFSPQLVPFFPKPLCSSIALVHSAAKWASRPNRQLNSDPACIVFPSFSSFRYLGFVHRPGAGGAG